MTDKKLVREVEINNPRDQDHIVKLDTRGRITIPASVRHRYGIDAEKEGWWVELTIHKLEKRTPADEDDRSNK